MRLLLLYAMLSGLWFWVVVVAVAAVVAAIVACVVIAVAAVVVAAVGVVIAVVVVLGVTVANVAFPGVFFGKSGGVFVCLLMVSRFVCVRLADE